MMKNIKNSSSYKPFLCALVLLNLVVPTYGMKRELPKTTESTFPLIEEKQPRIEKWRTVWIKSSDKQLIDMPEWQVDQVKVLQLLLAHQRGVNSKDNPQGTNTKNNPLDLSVLKRNDESSINAPAQILYLIRTALDVSNNPKNLAIFFYSLSGDDSRNLINGSFELEANGLSALLADVVLPQDIQQKIGFHMLPPLINYWLEKSAFKFIHPEIPQQDLTNFSYAVKISSNGKYALTNYRNNNIAKTWLWNIEAKTFIRTLHASFNNLQFSPGSTYIILHTNNKYDFYAGNAVIGTMHNTNCLTFSPDDNYCLYNNINIPGIINVSYSKNPQNWIVLNPLIGHTSQVNTIKFSPDGRYIISGSDGDKNNLILWDGITLQKIKVLEGHISNVTHADFTPDSKYIISHDIKNNNIIWDMKDKIAIDKTYFIYEPARLHTYFYIDKSLYLYQKYFDDGRQNQTDLKTSILPINTNSIISVESEPNNVLSFATKQKIVAKRKFLYMIDYAVESPNAQYLALANKRANRVWMLRLLKERQMPIFALLPTGFFNGIYFSPQSNYLITTNRNNDPNDHLVFSLWNMADIETISKLPAVSLSQARFLYRLYVALLNKVKVIIDENDQDYTAYTSLPKNVKDLVDRFLPFGISSEITQKALKEFRK